MKKIYTFSFLLILLTGILAFAPGQVSGTVYYVDGSKSDDSGDGLSWATAKQTLRAAFILAGLDDQIWIKAGAYLPTVNTTDPRDNSFFIPDGVSVYGGFAGFETSVGQRNLQANVTILSGDLGTPNDPSDNSYNVIYAGGEDWSAGVTLDGLTIQDGNADVSDNYYQEHGGGLYLSWYNTATVRNCTFKNNYAGYAGGGIHTREGTSLTIDNCKFTLNTAHRGGAVQISSNEAGYSSYAVIKNSEFWENKANWVSGGAIRVGYSDDFGSNDVTITNCIIRDNISDRGNGDGTGAGVMSVETGSVTRIINCAIYGNRAQGYDDGGGGGIYVYMGSVEVYNSTIANNYSATIGGAVAVKDNAGSLLIVNSIIAGNASGTGNSVSNIGGGSASARYTLIDDALACGQTCQNGISCGSGVLFGRNPSFVGSSNFQLQSCSPAIDKGNNGESNEQSTDLAGNARRYSPYGFSPATIDMGAYEFSNNVTVCSTCSPSSGSLSKSPNQSNVCIGGNVLANLSTKGSNGDGLDQLEYRTKTISGWSSWSCYNSGDNISTTDKTEVEIKTYRNSSYCVASTPTVANWVVDPLTVGGSVSGSSPVCQSCNSTTLTLSGQTGFVQNWQYSEDNSFWNAISGSTGTTYTAINLNVDTWFRVSVKSGTCPDQKSTPLKLTMYTPAIFSISGKAKYDNNPQTPLNGIMLVLSKKQGSAWVKTDSMVTSLSGNFTFGGLANAVYRVDAKSAHPSGQWQTWSGVNNTDYLLALRHATTGPLLPANPPVVRVSGDVKTPKTPPVITTVDADAIRMSAKYGWGSPKPYFDIPKWVFSGLNPETRIDSIVLACNNLTRDIMGLCAGDVNGSYLPPTGNKTAVETQGIASLRLENRGTLPITPEITFPVRVIETQGIASLQIGAITLMLDFDPSLIEITGVEMPENGGVEPWFETRDGVLNIGWMSLDPVRVFENGTVLVIHARANAVVETGFRPVSTGSSIRFTLNDNPLSELADGDGNVIGNAKLTIADAGNTSSVTRNNMVNVYPNPTSDIINIEYLMEQDGTFTAELVNLTGVVVAKTDRISSKAGMNKATMNLWDLPNGAYILKVTVGDQTGVRKVVVNR